MSTIDLRLLEEAQFTRLFIYIFAGLLFIILIKLAFLIVWLLSISETVKAIHKKVIKGLVNQEGFRENIQDMLMRRDKYDRWMEGVTPQLTEIATLLKVQPRNNNKNRNLININESAKIRDKEEAFFNYVADQLKQKDDEIKRLKKRLAD